MKIEIDISPPLEDGGEKKEITTNVIISFCHDFILMI